MAHKAVFSPDRRYRYALWRDTGARGGEGTVLFVGLNPSTADEVADDPTVRRCVRFARDWGFARMAMGNAYAYRATNPAELAAVDDPVGPDNDFWLSRKECLQTIAAWGANKYLTSGREADLITLLTYDGTLRLDCLGQTKYGRPRHPLDSRAATSPVVWMP